MITNFTSYVFTNEKYLDTLTAAFKDVLSEDNNYLKYLYILNDILQNSKTQNLTVFRTFSPLFESVIIKIAKSKDRGLISEAQNVIHVLENRNIFTPQQCIRYNVEVTLSQEENDEKLTSFLQLCDRAAELAEDYQNLIQNEEDKQKIINNLNEQKTVLQKINEFHSESMKRHVKQMSECDKYIKYLNSGEHFRRIPRQEDYIGRLI